MRRILFAALLVIGCTLAREARADAHDDADRNFREGRALYDAHDYAGACARFAESQRLEPAAGTLLNLADCYERVGRLATSLATYKEAAVAAALRKRVDWERFALARIEALRPAVPTLAIRASGAARVDGLVVTRDAQSIAAGDLGLELPVDPGKYVIGATAPGREPWSTTIEVQRGHAYVIEIPAPGEKATVRPMPKETAPMPPAEERSWQRPVGFAVTGVGAAALAFGAVSGVVALGARSDAVSKCPSYPTACTADGTSANERAFGWATVSTVSFVGGAILAAGGLVLLFTAPSGASARVGVSPVGSLYVAGEL